MEIRLRGPRDVARIDALFAAARAVDRRDPLSDHKHLDLDRGHGTAMVAEEGEELVAFAQVSPGGAALEMVVAPHRRDRALVERVLDAALAEAGRGPTAVWAFDPTQVAALETRGVAASREVHQLRGPLPDEPPPGLPPRYELRPFRTGRDETPWLDSNNAAFAGHPENSGWDLAGLQERVAQPWFDASGFLLAWDRDQLAGFCWTKMHSDGVGEIYVIAVTPGFQGEGLGRALTLAGLWYLKNRRQATSGMIYADGDNERALALYRSLGFEVVGTDYCFVI